MVKNNRQTRDIFTRNFIFGVEDSLVSTVGFLAGVAASGIDRTNIILTGAILIFVEAFSMGVGSFLSESSLEESRKIKDYFANSIKGALTMLLSYCFFGFIVLAPYLILTSEIALVISIAVSLGLLFVLGFSSAKLLKENIWRLSWRMLLVGGLAIIIGVAVGLLLKNY
ncbi:VIT1/CCC1 transporter family protein [Candidatus Microgenomates bacterium]|nr:VIT1/CCC1 transporter family protein [Candidatus Microgenomates bacterium]